MVVRSRIVWKNKRPYIKILKKVPRIDDVGANHLENKVIPEYVYSGTFPGTVKIMESS